MLPRHLDSRIRIALADTPVVLLAGPRQSGKTTLARTLATGGRTYVSLDNLTTLEAARTDPIGFIRNLGDVVIDEVQRVPELLLVIKESVDLDRRPGRFLLTGSANLMTLPRVADSLAGRMETIPLMPLAQAEILKRPPPRFLETLFEGKPPMVGPPRLGPDLIAMVLAGGYPEALARETWARRHNWCTNYVASIVDRDVRDIANIDQLDRMPRLLRALAEHSSQLVNHAGVGASLDLNHVTTQKYTGVFEQLFLVANLQPWHSNTLKRLTKKPKLHFLDSGLLAALRAVTPDRVAADRAIFGPILETFVFAELLKLASWSGNHFSFSYFRDKELNEVDIIIEDAWGRIVGIEIKAAASVKSSDFSGLRRLAEAAGKRFVFGVVLHDHQNVTPFGDRLAAAPFSSLWG